MVIAEDVYTYNNQLIFPKGLILTDKAITRMEFYSIMYVRVEDDLATPGIEEMPPSYAERLRKTPEFQEFQAEFEKDIENFKTVLNDVIEKGGPLDKDKLLKNTIDLISNSESYVSVFDMLHSMRQYDDSTYVHCVNVGLICNVFARWLRMSEEEVATATLCGILHDIGKLMIPDEIIRKPGKLTSQEYKIIKKHCQEGYKILANFDLDKTVKNASLMHHERCDGSGYPYGLTADRIDPFAKMVAIADVYDAMTSARIYRGSLCPFIVVAVFESEGLQKYDARFILTFLQNIVNTYLLHRVRLSNGIEGDIVFINREHLSMPTVKCGNQYIDLSQHPEIYIESMI
ncbi:MAG: HD-GYP domain-containing protein [Lachnospiraceae bacterium]|jgi:putative nucleotidyltransferase with HDIG domain|nr:HD-GYP domain-containing protein [Lachnospiraceae bacterium]